MASIQVTSGFKELTAKLTDLEKRQVPFAMAKALNATAKDVQKALRSELPSIFDRPTPFTMNSLAVIGATTKGVGRMEATLLVKDLQAKYLLPEELGGARLPSNNTRKPARALVLPAPALLLDRYGGIPRGRLAQLQAAASQGAAARRNWRSAAKAARAAGGKPPPAWPRDFGIFYWKRPTGIWAAGGPGYFIRQGGHFLKRLTAFKAETHYQPRLKFGDRSAQLARASFEANWRVALADALATAR